MNGLTLVSGINYSGKGTFLKLLKNEWEAKHGQDSAIFESASHAMMRVGGIANHNELGLMTPQDRNHLRNHMLNDVVAIAERGPVFLDMHFIFEDGERPDYLPIIPVVSGIVSILSDPEIILQRREKDIYVAQHPGRNRLTEYDFVDMYQRQEVLAMEEFRDSASQRSLRKIPITAIVNNYPTERELGLIVREIRPHIEESLKEGYGGMKEKNY